MTTEDRGHRGHAQAAAGTGSSPVPPPEPPLAFDSHGHEYTVEHDKVLTALSAAQDRQAQGGPQDGTRRSTHGNGVTVDEVAVGCDLPRARVDELLHELNEVFSLITRLAHEPGPLPRYEVRARL